MEVSGQFSKEQTAAATAAAALHKNTANVFELKVMNGEGSQEEKEKKEIRAETEEKGDFCIFVAGVDCNKWWRDWKTAAAAAAANYELLLLLSSGSSYYYCSAAHTLIDLLFSVN